MSSMETCNQMIRLATANDINRITEIYSHAREFMKNSGNPDQWGDTHPPVNLIEERMKLNQLYVDVIEDCIHGVCALVPGKDDTYSYIENGNWLNDEEYVTIHMVASSGEVKKVFESFCDYAKTLSANVRIDTHSDNKVMQHCIEKQGFTHCGTIYVRNHSPRLAYQWCKFPVNN